MPHRPLMIKNAEQATTRQTWVSGGVQWTAVPGDWIVTLRRGVRCAVPQTLYAALFPDARPGHLPPRASAGS